MKTHFHKELSNLEAAVIGLGRDVCQNVVDAVSSLRDMDKVQAVRVMRRDRMIDLMEVQNEETCLKIIALYQPVADDLRYLVVLNKVNHELERISDLAVAIARSALPPHRGVDDGVMGKRLAALVAEVESRLQRVLAVMPAKDADAARDIWIRDEEIDAQCMALGDDLQAAILSPGDKAGPLFAMFSAVGHIERMGDHVKNIAKDVLYLVLGEIVRHRSREFKPFAKGHKISVLFVCVHNSARSQMAEAWLNHLYGERFEASSAGLEPEPVNPLGVAAMRELGVDMSGHETTDVFDLLQSGRRFDYLITVCDGVHAEQCPPSLGVHDELHWPFPDPADAPGDEGEKLAFMRSIRDAIRDRINQWVANEVIPREALRGHS